MVSKTLFYIAAILVAIPLMLNCSSDQVPTSPDAETPTISEAKVGNITDQRAEVSWITSVPTCSKVTYSSDSLRFSASIVETTLVDSHNVVLANLAASATYSVEILSIDSNDISKAVFKKFTTLADTTAPQIIGPVVSNIGYNEATVSWQTNEEAISFVRADTSTSTSSLISEAMSQYSHVHSIDISGLPENDSIHCTIYSVDRNGNTSQSVTLSFKTKAHTTILYGGITGTVLYGQTKEPIVGAEIKAGTRVAVSDTTGAYAIDSVAYGQHLVTASKSDMETFSVNLLVDDSAETLNVEMVSNADSKKLFGYVKNSIGGAICSALVKVDSLSCYSDNSGYYYLPSISQGPKTITVETGYYGPDTLSKYVFVNDIELNIVLTALKPDAPQAVYLLSKDRRSLEISYPSITPTVIGYEIHRSTDSLFSLNFRKVRTADTSFTDSVLVPGAEYFYKIHAVNMDGIASDDTVVSFTTNDVITKVANFNNDQAAVSDWYGAALGDKLYIVNRSNKGYIYDMNTLALVDEFSTDSIRTGSILVSCYSSIYALGSSSATTDHLAYKYNSSGVSTSLTDLTEEIGRGEGCFINGKAYLFGSWSSWKTVEYNPDDKTSTAKTAPSPPTNPDFTLSACVAVNNKAYLIGYRSSTTYGPILIYDPSTDSWSNGAYLPDNANWGALAYNGKILTFCKGHHVHEYDPSTDRWRVRAEKIPYQAIFGDKMFAYEFNGKIYLYFYDEASAHNPNNALYEYDISLSTYLHGD